MGEYQRSFYVDLAIFCKQDDRTASPNESNQSNLLHVIQALRLIPYIFCFSEKLLVNGYKKPVAIEYRLCTLILD
jgi:hypothetical protein